MKSVTAFKNLEKSTHQAWFSGAFVVLRVGIGLQLFLAGVAKFGDWSAAGYLSGATGPFAEFFQSMAGSVLVDQLNVWGLTLVGLCLMLGLFVRPSAFFGAILMMLYYFAHFVQNTEHGIIEYHVLYTLIFVLFMAGGAGHVYGLDGLISRNQRKKNVWTKILFG